MISDTHYGQTLSVGLYSSKQNIIKHSREMSEIRTSYSLLQVPFPGLIYESEFRTAWKSACMKSLYVIHRDITCIFHLKTPIRSCMAFGYIAESYTYKLWKGLK